MLEPDEIKEFEFPDGSAIRMWVVEGENEVKNGQLARDPSDRIYNGSKTVYTEWLNIDTGRTAVTLKLKVDYEYGNSDLKLKSTKAWGEAAYGSSLEHDYRRTSSTSSYSESTVSGHYNVKFEHSKSGQSYTIYPTLKTKLTCTGDHVRFINFSNSLNL